MSASQSLSLKPQNGPSRSPSSLEAGLDHYCKNCGIPYNWRKSTSRYLKMTYCTTMCEKSHSGQTIESLLAAERKPSFIEAEAFGGVSDMQDWEDWLSEDPVSG